MANPLDQFSFSIDGESVTPDQVDLYKVAKEGLIVFRDDNNNPIPPDEIDFDSMLRSYQRENAGILTKAATVPSSILSGLTSGVLQAEKGFGGAAQYLGELIGNEWLSKSGENTRKYKQSKIDKVRESWGGYHPWLETGGEMAGNLGTALATSAVSGPLAPAVLPAMFGTQSLGETYGGYREGGYSPEQARPAANVSGLVSAMAAPLYGKLPGAFSGPITKTIAGAIEAMGLGALQELPNMAMEEKVTGQDIYKDIGDIGGAIAERLLELAVMGGLLTGAHALRGVRNKNFRTKVDEGLVKELKEDLLSTASFTTRPMQAPITPKDVARRLAAIRESHGESANILDAQGVPIPKAVVDALIKSGENRLLEDQAARGPAFKTRDSRAVPEGPIDIQRFDFPKAQVAPEDLAFARRIRQRRPLGDISTESQVTAPSYQPPLVIEARPRRIEEALPVFDARGKPLDVNVVRDMEKRRAEVAAIEAEGQPYKLRDEKAALREEVSGLDRELIDRFTPIREVRQQEAVAKEVERRASLLKDEKGSVEVPGIGPGVERLKVDTKEAWNKIVDMLVPERGITKGAPSEEYLSGAGGITSKIRLPYGDVIRKGLRTFFADNSKLTSLFPELAGPVYEALQIRGEKTAEVKNRIADITTPYFQLNAKERAPVDTLAISARLAAEEGRSPNITREWMKKKGFNEDQIDGFYSLRNGMDVALDFLEESLLAGSERIKPGENQARNKQVYEEAVKDYVQSLRDNWYVPFSRPGKKYEIRAFNPANGKPYANFFDSEFQAKKEVRKLKREGYQDIKFKKKPKTELNNEILGLPPPLMEVIQKSFDPETFNHGDLVGFRRHLAQFNAVEGWNPNLAQSVAEYIEGLGAFRGRKVTEYQIAKALDAIPLDTQPRLRNRLQKNVDAYDRHVNEFEGFVKNFVNTMNLAGVPVAGGINLTQSLTTTLPELTTYIKNPVKVTAIWTKAAAKAPVFILGSKAERTKAFRKNPGLKKTVEEIENLVLTPEEKVLLDRFREQGGYGLDNQVDLARTARGKRPGSLSPKDIAMLTFSIPEAFNRVQAYLVGLEVAKAKGISGAERFAKDFAKKTQFDQSKANLLPAQQNVAGSIMLQYKNYPINYFRFLKNKMTEGQFEAVAVSLAVQTMLAGAMGLPFAAQGKLILEGLGYEPVKFLREFFDDKKKANAVIYGLPTLSGTNVSASAAFQLVPDIDQDPFAVLGRTIGGPIGDYALSKIPKGIEALRRDEPIQALEQFGPRAFRGPLRAFRTARQGEMADIYGSPVIKNPGLADYLSLISGAQSQKAVESYEKRLLKNNLETESRDKAGLYNNLLAKAIYSKDKKRVRELVKEMLAEGVEPNFNEAIEQVLGMVSPDYRLVKQTSKKNRGQVLERIQQLNK